MTKAFDAIFNLAARNIEQIASAPCQYVRDGASYTIRAYWNAPDIMSWEAGEYDLDGAFREWYLNARELKRKGIGRPREFDRIIHGGITWEMYRDRNQSFMRDGTPDIVVLTRMVKVED